MIRVIMTTYTPANDCPRAGYPITVLHSLREYLHASEPIEIWIADDGSPEPHVKDIVGYAKELGFPFQGVGSSVVDRKGIGASLNRALGYLPDDTLWFYITDDWELRAPLDLTGPAKLIRDVGYDYVRVGPIHPNLNATVRYRDEELQYYLQLHPEHGGFCFATRPFLTSKWFWQNIGPFDEYKDAYDTERMYAERVTKNAVHVTLAYYGLLDTREQWKHIGEYEVGHIKPEAPTWT